MPSSIGIGSSWTTTVFGYCSPRGFQAAALDADLVEAPAAFVPPAWDVEPVETPAAFTSLAFGDAELVEAPAPFAASLPCLELFEAPANAANAPAVRVRVATEAAVSRVSLRMVGFLPVCREINEVPRREVTEP
jgi:hypothetical protein